MMSNTMHSPGRTESSHSFADDDIVITGISGRFPLADNLQELKDNLFSKRNCIVRAEERRSSELPGLSNNYIGTMKNMDKFDAEFFNMNTAGANQEDPQIRMLGEVCYEAIIDSGYAAKELSGKDIGVFMGIFDSDPMIIEKGACGSTGKAVAVGYTACMASNKLSHRCDITGPSLNVDTACSSSASALENAFQRLKMGTIEAALVGGTSTCLDPGTNKLYSDLGMLSPTGETCSYSKNANGFAVGEAAVIVFVQKKKHARRIYAKIHNMECSLADYQDAGLYSPSLKDQINLYRRTYNVIGMDPSLIGYMEGNGAARQESDATEVKSINEVFCQNRKTPLLLGSVKDNIGHTESASALCSIAKIIIAFETGAIPPNIHHKAPNPIFPSLTDGKIKVVTETTPFDRPLAAINNFSFRGNVVHMVLERNGIERSQEQKGSMLSIPKLIVYAATTNEALSSMFNYFHENSMPDEFFGLLNKSAYLSPLSAPYRGFTILKKGEQPIMSVQRLSPDKRQLWCLFTGIGCSQWLGIGLELMEIKVFAESLRRSAEILEPFGIHILELLNSNNCVQMETYLTSTFVSIIAIQIALVDVLRALGLEPDGIIGHSTGELVCSYADNCCTAEQTILSAYHIAVSVEKANLPPGAMATVGLTWEEAKRRCPEGIYPACHDAEDLVTVSGSAKAVESFVEELKKENIFATVLDTNGFAFHCRTIWEANGKLRRSLQSVYKNVQPKSKRWISTSYSDIRNKEEAFQIPDANYYCHSLESEVHFREVLTHIPSDAIIIGIGPNFLMRSIVTKAVGDQASYIDIPERTGSSILSLLSSIGKLYNLGLDPQVENIYEPVSYPVPRGTPMISPLIKWDHSKSFYVPKYNPMAVGQKAFFVKTKSNDKFLLDHCIEGRSLYPAAGYIYLAWKGLSTALSKPMDSLPVCIEDLKILRATILSANDEKKFLVRLLHKSGDFEITGSSSVLATGKIYVPATTMFDDPSHHYEANEDSVIVSGQEMYSELKIHGYEYGPAFQGLLEVNVEGIRGLVKWNDEWISFLDSLLLFFGIIYDNDDFRLPTGARCIKIDPTIHMDFVTRMKERGMKGIPVNYDINNRKCTTPGVEIRDLKLESAPRRSMLRGALVLEECSFVPYYETDAIFGKDKTPRYESYMEVCNYLGKQIVRNLKIKGKLQNIFEDLQFSENVEDQQHLLSDEEDTSLMESLRDVLEVSISPKSDARVEILCQNISDVLVEDMLFKCIASEKPMRSLLDVAVENCTGKMNIAEWCDRRPLLLTALQDMMMSSITIKATYILIHSGTTDLDTEGFNERDIQIEGTETNDVIPLNLSNSCHLAVTWCMVESRNCLKSRIRNVVSLTKDQGFILVAHKHQLTPAELLLYTLSKLPLTLHSEAEIEKIFQEEKLVVISKKSSFFGVNAYLLRKVPETPHIHEQYVVKVLDAEYDQWVEDLKKALSTVQKTQNNGVLLLVAQDCTINGIIGLAKCLRQEPGGEKIRCIFTDSSAPPFSLGSSFYTAVFAKDLFMNIYLNGTWGSFRHTTLAEDIPQKLCENASIECTKPGDLSSLQWWTTPVKSIAPEEHDDELYHVYYSALNFRDVMIGTGKITAPKLDGYKTSTSALGLEFSGRDKNGRRIMAVTSGCCLSNTYVQRPAYVRNVPDKWTLEEAATIPVVYSTCYYALIVRGELEYGERVLIHSGTGGIGQAAIRIALDMDCEIFATVGTPEKKDFLMKTFPQLKPENVGCSRDTTFEEMVMKQTKGEGVDVVLNSLADDKFQASVRCLGNHGRFLEIGKFDLQMNSPLGLHLFLKGISFHSCQLDSYFDRNQKSKDMFGVLDVLIADGIRRGVVQPLNTTVFSKDDVEKAFRYMGSGKHVGKVLIKIREEETERYVIPSPLKVKAYRKLSLHCNKSYIVIGGLGGFGIELAKWLVQKGAGTVILTSRYGARIPYHHLCLKRWESSGARVFVSTLDVSNRDEAQKLLEETSTTYGPIGGIFNSAVVLKDAFMENQTASAFEEVCAPKALATKNLDELTRLMCPELDIFVCFSSISCGKGNAGQTNYGYANSVMERICEKRVQDGLPGLAVQWGIIGDVGLVHRHMGDDAMIAGVVAQKIKSCLQCLDNFLLLDKPVVSSFVTADISRMKKKSEDVLSQVARVFGVTDVGDMNPYRTFGEMGIDSMAGVELRQMLQTTYDITFSLQEIQDMKVGDLKKLIEDKANDEGSLKPLDTSTQSINFNGLRPPLVREAVVTMNSVADGIPFFVIHGNDFLHEKHKQLYKRILHPVFALQSTQDTPVTSLEDMSLWFLAQIQKFCPGASVHLLSISSSGRLALEMALQSEKFNGHQPRILNLTILDGCLDLMDAHYTTVLEKNKHAATFEASDLCEFLSAFSDSDLTQLKKQLEKEPSVEDRIKTISSYLTPSDKSSFAAATELHVRKKNLMRFHAPKGKMKMDITAIEAAEKVLPNDVSAVKSFLAEVCDGCITIHRIVGSNEILLGESSIAEVSNLLNKLCE